MIRWTKRQSKGLPDAGSGHPPAGPGPGRGRAPACPRRALGAPLHTHHNEDEYSYVLQGRFGVQLGDDVFEAGPGDLVVKPRGLAHAFWNAGEEPARLLELISPAGFENYFREVAPLLAATT